MMVYYYGKSYAQLQMANINGVHITWYLTGACCEGSTDGFPPLGVGGAYTPIQSSLDGSFTPLHLTVTHSPDLFNKLGLTLIVTESSIIQTI